MPPGFDFPGSSSFWLNRHLLAYPGRYARWMDVVGATEYRGRPGDGAGRFRGRRTPSSRRVPQKRIVPTPSRCYRYRTRWVGDTRATPPGASRRDRAPSRGCVRERDQSPALPYGGPGQEIALRTALGAGRTTLSRQLLTESLVLAGVGAVVGTALAAVAIRGCSSPSVPRTCRGSTRSASMDASCCSRSWRRARPDCSSVWLALVRIARTDVRDALREGVGDRREASPGAALAAYWSSPRSRRRWVLVVGAGLMSRSYVSLLDTDPGFNATSVLTLRVDLPSGAYGELERVSDFHAPDRRSSRHAARCRFGRGHSDAPLRAGGPLLGQLLRPESRGTPPGGGAAQSLPSDLARILRDDGHST